MSTKTIVDVIRENLFPFCLRQQVEEDSIPTLEELKLTEWCATFEAAARKKLIQGAFRYGTINSQDKPTWDRVSSMFKRLKQYTYDGNTEHLVDIRNLAMLLYLENGGPEKMIASGEENAGLHDVPVGTSGTGASDLDEYKLKGILPPLDMLYEFASQLYDDAAEAAGGGEIDSSVPDRLTEILGKIEQGLLGMSWEEARGINV